MKRLSLFVTLGLTGLLLSFFVIFPEFDQWTQEAYQAVSSGDMDTIKSFLNDFSWFGYLILWAVFLVQMLLFVLPSVMVMSLSILMCGPFIGVLLCLVGVGLASSIAYLIGVLFGDVTVDRMVGKRSESK